MGMNAQERLLLLVTAAFALFCFGFFWGSDAVQVRSETSSYSEQADHQTTDPLPDEEQKRVDLNTADLTQLMTLPGIGPVLAGRILDYRAEFGPFAAVQELTKVDGIGEKTLAELLDYIFVG